MVVTICHKSSEMRKDRVEVLSKKNPGVAGILLVLDSQMRDEACAGMLARRARRLSSSMKFVRNIFKLVIRNGRVMVCSSRLDK